MITFLSPIHFHSCVMVYGFFRLCVDFDFTIVRFVVRNVMNLNVLCIECLFSLHRSEIVDLTKQNEQKIWFMCCNFGDVLVIACSCGLFCMLTQKCSVMAKTTHIEQQIIHVYNL